MNPIAEEILMHYGMPRRSGRYPWGSGENPYQHSGDFLSRIDELKSQGMSDTEIAKAMGLTTTQYRTQKSLAKDERRALDVARAKSLREDGLSLNEIAKEMGFANDSSVRSLLNENSEVRMNQAKTTAEFIKKQIDEKGMIDVGAGVERELGISKEKLNEALYMLEMEGYVIFSPKFENVINTNYLESKKTLKTVTLVAGEGEGADRKTTTVACSSGAGTGLNRRELYTDARDVSSTVDNETLTDAEYKAQLSQRGLENLAENIATKSFEGKVETTRMYRYGEDFFLGDMVQIVNEYGIEGKARVTEFIRSQSKEGLDSYPTFVTVE